MEQFNSNTDSSAVSDTSAMQDIQSDDVSSQTVVSYRHRQLVEDARVVQSNNPHGVFSSAIWRLPKEILAEIFLYCMPVYEISTPSPHVAPLLLTRVCKRWREIALDMPNLWCRLRLEVGPSNWLEKAVNSYDFYLKQPRGPKLSLLLDGVNHTNCLELESLLRADSLAIADVRGISELLIWANGDVPTDIMRYIAQLPPSMRSLCLNVLFHLALLPGVNSLGWASLTNIEIEIEGLDCFVRLLQLCPNLSSLTMTGWFTRIETPEAFVHPKLQYLRLSAQSDYLDVDIVDFGLFNAITLPNLRGIEVRKIGPWPHEEFKAFLTRSQCPLKSLIFGGGVMITDRQLAEYATLFPSLYLVKDPTRSSRTYYGTPIHR
ncbi:uncharacterized protein EDB93DRAFT_1336514 [Suillus bovinus]|uniref:uncharacterized protein n=1 Tax=Suillus bovinus TaxID=48563 RepID=UPI001B87AE84|nr:uncharacterized protein EDB93DRAFT_1336514 [Suillus bovinus]KAG2152571.1 hypothetical protein EDB93DRAFT_1336514 [Suillus bovinus]